MIQQFQFRNFKPKEDLSIRSNVVLYECIDEVPFGVLKKATVSKVNERFFCYLEILSGKQSFTAISSSVSPVDGIEKLHKNLRDQVADWQRKRVIAPLLDLCKTASGRAAILLST